MTCEMGTLVLSVGLRRRSIVTVPKVLLGLMISCINVNVLRIRPAVGVKDLLMTRRSKPAHRNTYQSTQQAHAYTPGPPLWAGHAPPLHTFNN